MAHEIDAIELVAEALAGRERGLEVGLAEHVSVHFGLGNDRGVARLAADQRDLAEEIPRPEPRYFVIGADYFDLAVRDKEELFSGLPLADDRLSRGVVALLHVFGDIGELPRRQILE